MRGFDLAVAALRLLGRVAIQEKCSFQPPLNRNKSEATAQVVPLSEAREARRAGPELILAPREPEILLEM